MDFEALRQQYKPDKIKILMIADSPPGNGSHFFYDFSSYDDLRALTKESFEYLYLDILMSNDEQFLDYYKSFGFYLDDLCHTPVNRLKTETEKAVVRAESIPKLAARLRVYKDTGSLKAIIIVSKEIKKYVDDAIDRAKIPGSVLVYNIVFPSQWNSHKEQYVTSLTDKLIQLQKAKIL